ncbi:MAG: DNA gyrase subunit A, partial [Candidatus Magasanikbacteria bacterium]|nr:DNA gyrase subunit A [Candidatus Magasanikbacteria bacterium]
KHTPMQSAFSVNMLALVDGQPRVLSLKEALQYYIDFRREVITRRSRFDLKGAKARAHILEGLHIALNNIDTIIKVIKQSEDKEAARVELMKKFKLTEIQANAILEMKLSQLANLERMKIENELKEKRALIKELEIILGSAKKILEIVKKEVAGLKEKYGDARRTQIVKHGVKEFTAEDLIPNEETILIMTHDGYIKRLPPDTFKTQGRGGKGVIGLTTKEEDVVEQMFATTTHADLLFFTTRGRVFQLKAYDVPSASRTAKGQALVNFLQLAPNEKISAVLSGEDLAAYKFLVMTTQKGLIKKVALDDFKNVRRSGLIAIRLKTDDTLSWVRPSTGKDDVMIITENAQAIRFRETQVRAMGRTAAGVRGIRLKKNDLVVGMDVLDPNLILKGVLEMFVVAENGLGKRSRVKEYKVQGRGGGGIKTSNVTAKTGKLVAAHVVNSSMEGDVLVVSNKGQVIRLPFGTIPTIGRATQGVRIMRFKEEGDKVANVTLL